MKITVEIATPEKLVLSEPAEEVVLPSVEGYMGVRAGHAPLLARLDAGEISCNIGGTEKIYAVAGGFAEVLRDGVVSSRHTAVADVHRVQPGELLRITSDLSITHYAVPPSRCHDVCPKLPGPRNPTPPESCGRRAIVQTSC